MMMMMMRAAAPLPHLSITARHSFLHVKRLPRRSRKVPGAVAMGGGVCLHSISSMGRGAGRMLRVAPGTDRKGRGFRTTPAVYQVHVNTWRFCKKPFNKNSSSCNTSITHYTVLQPQLTPDQLGGIKAPGST